MILKLNQEKIQLFKRWLDYYSNPNLDATHTGIYAGVKYTLTKFNLYYSVAFYQKEDVVDIDQNTITEVIKKCKVNSVEAMWNLGVASGIAWVLEEFDIPID